MKNRVNIFNTNASMTPAELRELLKKDPTLKAKDIKKGK